MIERCIFIICLDKKTHLEQRERKQKSNVLTTIDDRHSPLENGVEENMSSMSKVALQMLHGGSSDENSGNRWFDKTMQFVICEDGSYGINFEHSPAEGIVVIELSEHLYNYMLVLCFVLLVIFKFKI